MIDLGDGYLSLIDRPASLKWSPLASVSFAKEFNVGQKALNETQWALVTKKGVN